MKKAYAMMFALLVIAGLSACGQKGPLVLPPPEPAQQEEPADSE
ncbi:LPS translocon maturation chaperone LptM [Pseudoteredinibacter isoporae]